MIPPFETFVRKALGDLSDAVGDLHASMLVFAKDMAELKQDVRELRRVRSVPPPRELEQWRSKTGTHFTIPADQLDTVFGQLETRQHAARGKWITTAGGKLVFEVAKFALTVGLIARMLR